MIECLGKICLLVNHYGEWLKRKGYSPTFDLSKDSASRVCKNMIQFLGVFDPGVLPYMAYMVMYTEQGIVFVWLLSCPVKRVYNY